jgi:hypothetical protein
MVGKFFKIFIAGLLLATIKRFFIIFIDNFDKATLSDIFCATFEKYGFFLEVFSLVLIYYIIDYITEKL